MTRELGERKAHLPNARISLMIKQMSLCPGKVPSGMILTCQAPLFRGTTDPHCFMNFNMREKFFCLAVWSSLPADFARVHVCVVIMSALLYTPFPSYTNTTLQHIKYFLIQYFFRFIFCLFRRGIDVASYRRHNKNNTPPCTFHGIVEGRGILNSGFSFY